MRWSVLWLISLSELIRVGLILVPVSACIVVPAQVYQLQSELQKAQIENEFQKRRSLRCGPHAETQLQEEVRSLRCQLVKAEKLDPVGVIADAATC